MAQAKIMLNTFNNEQMLETDLGQWTCLRGPHDDQTFRMRKFGNVLTVPVIRDESSQFCEHNTFFY